MQEGHRSTTQSFLTKSSHWIFLARISKYCTNNYRFAKRPNNIAAYPADKSTSVSSRPALASTVAPKLQGAEQRTEQRPTVWNAKESASDAPWLSRISRCSNVAKCSRMRLRRRARTDAFGRCIIRRAEYPLRPSPTMAAAAGHHAPFQSRYRTLKCHPYQVHCTGSQHEPWTGIWWLSHALPQW